jgi:predicted  nucleic acid-binding Zn-ribbon protein
MTQQDEVVKSCEQCGATIYPEHITTGRAMIVGGKLLCPICLGEKKGKTAAGATAIRPAVQEAAKPAVTQAQPASASGDETLSLVDEKDVETSGRKIEALGSKAKQAIVDETKLHRELQRTGTGATRIKIFHAKMNDGAVDFMIQTINEWIDAHPDVEVKNVQTTVGTWEGKHPEPHLIMTLLY